MAMDYFNRNWTPIPMKLWAFKQCSSMDRINIVGDDGTFLALRENQKFMVALYRYGDFFVELVVDKKTETAIRATPLLSKTKLDVYLDLICIDELFT